MLPAKLALVLECWAYVSHTKLVIIFPTFSVPSIIMCIYVM